MIFVAEIVAILTHFEVPSPQYYFVAKPESAWLFELSKEYWQIGAWLLAACLLTISPQYKAIYGNYVTQTRKHDWKFWLTFHIFALTTFVILTAYIYKQPADPARLTISWFSIWFTTTAATFFTWLLMLAPKSFWLWLLEKNQKELFVGGLLGISAWLLLKMLVQQEAPLAQKELWGFLSGATLQIVYFLVAQVYSDLVYKPELAIVGTQTFPVEVTYACSGIEGVSLIVIFLAIYLWLFRKNLHFPQVLWLFPIAMIAIWLTNALRIALLIAVGTSISPQIASMGFHAQAGWIAFTLISLGAITLTHRLRFFSAHQIESPSSNFEATLSTALLAPFLVQMAALMLTSAFSSDFDWLYPARIFIIAITLYCYRKAYTGLFSKLSWEGPTIGIAVFIAWIMLEPANNRGTLLAEKIKNLPSEWAICWLIFRVIGSVIVIPVAEELAFRGYLIRKLVANDFEAVDPKHFTWLSFLLSSLLFGLLHDRWFAGTIAGMAYAFALYKRGKVSDALVAHMTTNALIAVFVLFFEKWSLWA